MGREHCSNRKTERGRETHKDTRRQESLLVVSPGFSSPLITLQSLHRSQSGQLCLSPLLMILMKPCVLACLPIYGDENSVAWTAWLFSKNGRTVWENEGDGLVLSEWNREVTVGMDPPVSVTHGGVCFHSDISNRTQHSAQRYNTAEGFLVYSASDDGAD